MTPCWADDDFLELIVEPRVGLAQLVNGRDVVRGQHLRFRFVSHKQQQTEPCITEGCGNATTATTNHGSRTARDRAFSTPSARKSTRSRSFASWPAICGKHPRHPPLSPVRRRFFSDVKPGGAMMRAVGVRINRGSRREKIGLGDLAQQIAGNLRRPVACGGSRGVPPHRPQRSLSASALWFWRRRQKPEMKMRIKARNPTPGRRRSPSL